MPRCKQAMRKETGGPDFRRFVTPHQRAEIRKPPAKRFKDSFFEREGSGENILENSTQLIGWTPLVETSRICAKEGVVARIVVKLESYQPGGSIKDRAALMMILDAESKGLLKRGVSTIVEATSGDTGISLALVGLIRGYKVIVVMPLSYSLEQRMILKGLGAQVIIADDSKGFEHLFELARELAATTPDACMLEEAKNAMNLQAHFETTGPEIWEDSDGQVGLLVAECGSGGTVWGTGSYLKSQNPDLKVIAVNIDEQPVSSGFQAPSVTDTSVIDKVVTVSSEEAREFTLKLMREEGLIVGTSSGAAFAAAVKEGKLEQNAGKMIVVILPSGGERYLSTSTFDSIRNECASLPVKNFET